MTGWLTHIRTSKKCQPLATPRPILQSWVNGFALQRPIHKNAHENSAERFLTYESLPCFSSQGEFTKSRRSVGAKTSALEPLQVFGQRVFGFVDDPEVFSSSHLNGSLCQPFPYFVTNAKGFYYHALTAACCQVLPPPDSSLLIRFLGEIHNSERRRKQNTRISGAKSGQRLHMPHVSQFVVCMP